MRERFGDDVVEWDFYPRLYAPGRIERSATVAEGVARVAARLGAHPSQVAIAWVLAQPGVTAAICGTRSPAHARANAEATRLELDAETVGELARLIPLGPTYG